MPETSRDGLQEQKEAARKVVVEIGSSNQPAFVKFRPNEPIMQVLRNSQYYCVDISMSALKQQPNLDSESEKNGIKLIQVQADGRKLPFADSSVDTVLLADVLSYRVLPQPIEDEAARLEYLKEESVSLEDEMKMRKELLDEIHRVLKQGGQLISGDFYRILHSTAYHDSLRALKQDKRFIHSRTYEYNNGKMGQIETLQKA